MSQIKAFHFNYKRLLSLTKKIWGRLMWILTGCPKPRAPLEMVWSQERLDESIPIIIPSGYTLRQLRANEYEAYFTLLASAGMEQNSVESWLDYWEKIILPGGFFVIVHDETKDLVATCLGASRPSLRHPCAGALGWLGADPEHKGRQLGRAVSAAVTMKLIASGYQRIYLETHDFRLAAIKTYLDLGWTPMLYNKEMRARWNLVCEKLEWPFTPDDWECNNLNLDTKASV
jgi:mycothiol synthase